MRLTALRAAVSARLRMERGSVLIEVMVGAVILAIATAAILDGLDGAQATGARNKARSVAAALAEQDQERMRSMPVASLAGYSRTEDIEVRNVKYTVKSTATWAIDSTATISCSNNSRTAANIRIVSEVTSSATRGIVDMASLVTPPPGTYAPGEGRQIIKVVGGNQAPRPGVAVTLTGPGSYSGVTNSLGCAVFPNIPVGNYTATVNQLSLVDWQGQEAPISKSTSVTEGTSTTTLFELDSKAEIRAQFDTRINTTTVQIAGERVSVANGKLTVGARSVESSTGNAINEIAVPNLFPFVDGYAVYGGDCSQNNPQFAPTNNASHVQTFTPTPGQVLTTSPRVRLPAINLRVVTSTSTSGTTGPAGVNNATIFLYPYNDDGECSHPDQQTSSTMNWGGTNYAGSLQRPGQPYGQYRICAQRTVSGTTTHGHADQRTGSSSGSYGSGHMNDVINNTNPNGNTVSWGSNGFIRILLNQSGPCVEQH